MVGLFIWRKMIKADKGYFEIIEEGLWKCKGCGAYFKSVEECNEHKIEIERKRKARKNI